MCILLEGTDFLTVGTYGCFYYGKEHWCLYFLNVVFLSFSVILQHNLHNRVAFDGDFAAALLNDTVNDI